MKFDFVAKNFYNKVMVKKIVISILLIITLGIAIFYIINQQKQKTVVFLGDSITEIGWDLPFGYIRQLDLEWKKQKQPVKIVAAGVSGNTSIDILKRLDKDVLAQKPNIVFVMCGINDIWHEACSVDEFIHNIQLIVEEIQKRNIRVILMTMTPITEDFDNKLNISADEYNGRLKSFTKQKNIELIDVNSAFKKEMSNRHKPSGLFVEDGVHLTENGNKVLADVILQNFNF